MKKTFKIFLTLIIFILPFITNIGMVNAEILSYGDVDENSYVTIGDATLVDQYLRGTTDFKPIQMKLADMNGSGSIESYDSKAIQSQASKDTLSNKIKSSNGEALNGTYQPIYDETCKAGYGEVEKCISNYYFTSEESGVYVQKDDENRSIEGKPTYYYRGSINNNYVTFGTYKEDIYAPGITTGNGTDTLVAKAGEPILWRIVRINEDGTIRLIMQHQIPGLINWGSADGKARYVNEDGSASDVKAKIDEWYNTTIKSQSNLDSLVANGRFCNDISNNYEGAKERYEKNNPTFICPEGGLVINEKAGLITMDEILFAGGRANTINSDNNTYIYNKTNFWTMTPRQTWMYWASYMNVLSQVSLVNHETNIRPVINLKADVRTVGGTGTKENPYAIEIDRPVIMNNIDNPLNKNVITQSVLDSAKENKKTLTYETYNTATNNGDGKYLYTWKIDADNITTTKDINTIIDINTLKETDNQTYSRIKHAIKKDDADVKYLTFAEDGNIGSTATITVDVSDMGSNVSVYKWESDTNTIKVVKANQTVEDGKVSFEISDNTNTKSYFITKGVLSESIVGNPNTGMMMFYIIGGISVLLIAGITYLIYSKKNNKFLKA